MSTLATQRLARPDQASKLRLSLGHDIGTGVRSFQGRGGVTSAAKVIALASGKGGVGKSNIAVNMAVCLSRSGQRVVVVDADVGLANADVLCGVEPRTRLDRALSDERSIESALVEAPGGFRLLAGSVGLGRLETFSAGQRDELLERLGELDSICDVLIIDVGAGIGATVRAMAGASDLLGIVAVPEPTSIADAYALMKVARQQGLGRDVGLIVNQAITEHEGLEVHGRIDGASRRFLGCGVDLLGSVPTDVAVQRAVRARVPFTISCPRTAASVAVADLALTIGKRVGADQRSVGGQRSAGDEIGFWGRLNRILGGRV